VANYKTNKPYSPSWNGVRSKYEYIPDINRPYPPANSFVTSPYINGILDIRWDNPLEVSHNSNWQILGVNIYRSENSEAGPFYKINSNPIQSLYFRDQTSQILVADEDGSSGLQRGSNARGEWLVKTKNFPLVKPGTVPDLARSPEDVVVKIDNGDGNLVVVPALRVVPEKGEIYLITQKIYNPKTKKLEDSRLPYLPNGRIYISYNYNSNLVRTDLMPRFFYKIVTVGRNKDGEITETKLDDVMPINVNQIEKPHYIWKGIIAKNRYLLEQFGERCKLFVRKETGERCPNYINTHSQACNVCRICFGTGFVGGYEGPIDITVAPPEAEKHIDLTDTGLKLNFSFESWTGPSPLLRTRDFIVRQNGERMMIGSVTPQGAKGSVFQQHFMLHYRDSKDIIYQVSIDGSQINVPVIDDTRNINKPVTDSSPVIPEHKSERAKTDKGRSIDYENVTW
jgi:hypothetical protein